MYLTHIIIIMFIYLFLINICKLGVPNSVQIDLLRWILISLPDENRLVLQKLLYLLNHLSRHSDVTEVSDSCSNIFTSF